MLVALVTGITGQDGSYLAELLLRKDYSVWGLVRRTSSEENTSRIKHILPQLTLRHGDLTDGMALTLLLAEIERSSPQIERLEIYNLAAMSHVHVSFDMPEYTAQVDAVGVLRMLEAIRQSSLRDKCRFYQASTSELYGLVQETPQDENTPFYPRSPYGVAKLYAYWIVKNYRESYGLFACNGILFNHESPRRGPSFVTRKITLALQRLQDDPTATLVMGNLDAMRDWGHAKDYVEGMWRMLQGESPDDYVLSTDTQHSVREFIEQAFALRHWDVQWRGSGLAEEGYDARTGRTLVTISEEYFRPAEVQSLLGTSRKAREQLGWIPAHTFDDVVRDMVEQDCPT